MGTLFSVVHPQAFEILKHNPLTFDIADILVRYLDCMQRGKPSWERFTMP